MLPRKMATSCTFTNDDLERFSQDNPTLSFDLRDPESYPASP